MHVMQRRVLMPTMLFDLEDRYARERGVRGLHPRPIEPVTFWLVGQIVGGNRQEFDRPLPMTIVRNPSGYHLFFGAVKQSTGADRRLTLADGTYIVRVQSLFYQTIERADIVVPMQNPNDPASSAPYHFDLEPNYAYPFPNTDPLRLEGVQATCGGSTMRGGRGSTLLRGGVHLSNGEGLAGATVQVVGQSNVYRTDATGQWVLWFPDDQPTGMVVVRVTMPGGRTVDVPDVCVVHGRETSLFETALRGWVQRAGMGVLGATINVSAAAGPLGSTSTGKDGSWTYYFDLLQAEETVTVTAILPDNQARLVSQPLQVRPRATLMVPTFHFS